MRRSRHTETPSCVRPRPHPRHPSLLRCAADGTTLPLQPRCPLGGVASSVSCQCLAGGHHASPARASPPEVDVCAQRHPVSGGPDLTLSLPRRAPRTTQRSPAPSAHHDSSFSSPPIGFHDPISFFVFSVFFLSLSHGFSQQALHHISS